MDVVWLKKDIRLHDHAPLSLISSSSSRPCLILYLYEPDQLSEYTVHGSHVAFVNEGLVDLDKRLSGCSSTTTTADVYQHLFQCITVCHAGAVFTLSQLHKANPIKNIYCHMESAHLKSFARDKAVRKWCISNEVTIKEFNQTGVTRCLSSRDDFSTNFKRFLDEQIPPTPTAAQLHDMRQRLINADGINLHGTRCTTPLKPTDIKEIQYPSDRNNRQHGGESLALEMLRTFLSHRGANYSTGISSPNSSWTSCSRLSPYLTWGHISLRLVIVTTKSKQEELRALKKTSNNTPSPWLRSLASFSSRMHWRSHFIQKLESQPSLEIEDQCLAYSHLRRQPNDFNQEYYDAWCTGNTGYPFVDACMRCLHDCGWINFRMRAMLVSFATYNLWLDWKRIAGHLARLFLDYEPGIHYPQLQMQAGTTGINAMRVYNVTKQGKDQDPAGIFIRKYAPELRNVPNEYIHEPSNMPISVQKKCRVMIGNGERKPGLLGFQTIKQSTSQMDDTNMTNYPSPIVDEKTSAKVAKDKLSAVRKQEATKLEAQQVFLKHGSRRSRGEEQKVMKSTSKKTKVDKGQKSLLDTWNSPQQKQISNSQTLPINNNKRHGNKASKKSPPTIIDLCSKNPSPSNNNGWSCKVCTYLNEKPLALACSICGSIRQ